MIFLLLLGMYLSMPLYAMQSLKHMLAFIVNILSMFVVKCSRLFYKVCLSIQFLFHLIILQTWQLQLHTNPLIRWTYTLIQQFYCALVFYCTSHVHIPPTQAVVMLNSYSSLHVCDVLVSANLLCHVRKISSPTPSSKYHCHIRLRLMLLVKIFFIFTNNSWLYFLWL